MQPDYHYGVLAFAADSRKGVAAAEKIPRDRVGTFGTNGDRWRNRSGGEPKHVTRLVDAGSGDTAYAIKQSLARQREGPASQSSDAG